MVLSEDRQDFLNQIRKAKAVDKVKAITVIAKGKEVLDAGFLNHTLEGYKRSSLHKKLVKVSKKVVGVDLHYSESMRLENCFCVDMTIPLQFRAQFLQNRESFDLVVAADLIEHLNTFKGFLHNCEYLLKSSGQLILTTPNPFYIDGWLYSWLRSDELVNPDHVCWIDPFNMKELLNRYGFEIKEFYWLKNRWSLAAFITQRKSRWYNHEIANWEGKQTKIEKAMLPFTMAGWMILRKTLTLFSPLNRWSGYMVVCERKEG